MKKATSYRLSEQAFQVIEETKKNKSLTSNAQALEAIIRSYARQQALPEEFLTLYANHYGAELEALKRSTRAMETQLAILVEMVNSLTVHFGLQNLSSVESDPSPLYTQAKEAQKARLAREKQIHDHKYRNYKE